MRRLAPLRINFVNRNYKLPTILLPRSSSYIRYNSRGIDFVPFIFGNHPITPTQISLIQSNHSSIEDKLPKVVSLPILPSVFTARSPSEKDLIKKRQNINNNCSSFGILIKKIKPSKKELGISSVKRNDRRMMIKIPQNKKSIGINVDIENTIR